MSKIFIVDEDINVLSSLKALLNLSGHQANINQGQSLEETLQQIKVFNPDFLIFEPNLTKFSGFELLKISKSDLETSAIPIFIFSNSDNPEDKTKALVSGAAQYFNKKELMIDDFIAKLNKIIINQQKQLASYENQT